MKLKTLKDLKEKWGTIPNKQVEIIFKELKTEAVKWVKEFRKGGFENWRDEKARKGAEQVLINFFNLTEEDLT